MTPTHSTHSTYSPLRAAYEALQAQRDRIDAAMAALAPLLADAVAPALEEAFTVPRALTVPRSYTPATITGMTGATPFVPAEREAPAAVPFAVPELAEDSQDDAPAVEPATVRRGGRQRMELTGAQIRAIRLGVKHDESINQIAQTTGLAWATVKRTIDTWRAEGQL